MGPLPPAPKVVRIQFTMVLPGDNDVMCRLFLQYTGALSAADAQTLCATAFTSWGNRVMPIIANNVTFNQAQLTDLSSSTSPQVNSTGVVVGGINQQAVPNGVAMVVSLKLGRRYRGGHPRIYIPGLPFSDLLNSDQWTAASTAAMAAAITQVYIDIETAPPVAVGTLHGVNVSFFAGFHNVTFPSGRTKPVPTLRGTPVIDALTGVVTNPKPASQRRRNKQAA